jgi:hypothetical protein
VGIKKLFGGYIMFLFLVLAVVVALIIAVAANISNSKAAAAQLISDERLKGAKLFKEIITTPVAINEEGNIGIINTSTKEIKVFNIKDVNGFEVIIDGKNVANIGGAIVGGLLFGGIGAIVGSSANKQKINSIDLLFKTNDFNNPTINVPLLSSGTKKGSMVDKAIQKEITELTSTLEIVEKKIKGQ